MSTNIEKIASLTPPQILLLSMLGGGSVFAGMRYLTELGNKVSPQKPPKDKLELDLANPMTQTGSMDQPDINPESVNPMMDSGVPGIGKAAKADPWWLPHAALITGVPAGFLGTKAIYDHMQKKEDDENVEESKKSYVKQLRLAQQMNKAGQETPFIDNFCEAAASELEKNAGFLDMLNKMVGLPNKFHGLDPVKKWGLLTAGGLTTGGAAWAANPAGRAIVRNKPELLGVENPVTPGVTPKQLMTALPDPNTDPVTLGAIESKGSEAKSRLAQLLSFGYYDKGKDAWKGIVGMGALGTLGTLLYNHHKKNKKEQKAEYPTGLTYAK